MRYDIRRVDGGSGRELLPSVYVPSSWQVGRLRNAFTSIRNGLTLTQVEESEITIPVTRIETISNGAINYEKTGHVLAEDVSVDYLLKKGDVLFSHINSLKMIGNCACYDGERPLVHGMNLLRLQPRETIDIGFVVWWLRSSLGRQTVESRSKPAINQASIPVDALKSIPLPLPSMKEQQTIARFLDHETAKIDELIAQQEKLIALLKEKRQAVISHAVTKGLNPDAPMKDSGVEWLGEVPAHWVVRRIKHLAVLQSGIAKGRAVSEKAINVPMLRVANVQDGYADLEDVHSIEIEPDELKRYSLRKGDLLMNEGGDNDKLGRGTIWSGEISPCIHQNHVFAIRPYAVDPEWLSWVTRSDYAKFHFYRTAKQSTNLASISSTNIKETPIVVPPQDERESIIDHIARNTKKIDEISDNAAYQIDLLKERRTALISAAVTGKIDVRNWQPESPQQHATQHTEQATAE